MPRVSNQSTPCHPAGPRSQLYIGAVLTTVFLTVLGVGFRDFTTPIDQALVYVTGVVLVAARFGQGPSLLYSILSVTCFNFFFIPPIYTFNVYDRSYWLTFIVMLITGFVIANQASRLRMQAISARKREHDTETFFALTKKLASMAERTEITNVTAEHIVAVFDAAISVWLPDKDGQLQSIMGRLPVESAKETSVLQWCFKNGQIAGRHTATMPSASGLYFPLVITSGILGVVCVISEDNDRKFSFDEIAMLETFANLLASALERTHISEMAEQSKVDVEREKLRTMLLSSVSHDLRTPLASITGAASTIVADIDTMPRETIRDLSRSINKESERLSHIVVNLLEATRLESGAVQLNKQPYFIEELIGSALERLALVLSKHTVAPRSEEELPLVQLDGVLIEQVLINLLENAARYTPEGSTIVISAMKKGATVLVSVADNGPGIPSGAEKKVFDKFYSMRGSEGQKGTGLGLAICASIIKAHQGDIWVEAQAQKGACFCFTLPAAETATQGLKNVANS